MNASRAVGDSLRAGAVLPPHDQSQPCCDYQVHGGEVQEAVSIGVRVSSWKRPDIQTIANTSTMTAGYVAPALIVAPGRRRITPKRWIELTPTMVTAKRVSRCRCVSVDSPCSSAIVLLQGGEYGEQHAHRKRRLAKGQVRDDACLHGTTPPVGGRSVMSKLCA